MSILRSTKAGKYNFIEKWLNKNGIENFKIEEDFTINVEKASVNLVAYDKEKLSSEECNIKFGEIKGGDFLCSYGKFTSMEGFPTKVEGRFDMRYTRIKNFDDVPELTEINDYAFAGCIFLQEVKIPSTVKKIGKYAFYNCSNLTKIEIPKSIEEIAENAFEGCTSLKIIQKY